jgi:hypothetical protein
MDDAVRLYLWVSALSDRDIALAVRRSGREGKESAKENGGAQLQQA